MRAALTRRRDHQLHRGTRGLRRPRALHPHVSANYRLLTAVVSPARQSNHVGRLLAFKTPVAQRGNFRRMHPLLRATGRPACRGVLFPLFVLGASGVPGPAGAQSVISLGDSVTRRVAAHSRDSVFVSLGDGDYVRLVVTHPAGLAMSVIRPSGDRLRPFITPSQKGVNPIAFVAEGAGRYAVSVTNDGDAPLRYDVAFRERLSLDERTPTVPRRDAVPSPRIEAIRRQVESGKTNTADFWSAVVKEGAPLVEPLDERYDLVTFLWRAQGDTRNVFLNASFRIPRAEADQPLYQLGASDIWYVTVTLPKGARFTYQLEPNRPTVPGMARVTAQADPLNRGMKLSCPT